MSLAHVRKTWEPFMSGFYCQDTSIRYPYQDADTVSDTMLLLVCVAVPLALVSFLQCFYFVRVDLYL